MVEGSAIPSDGLPPQVAAVLSNVVATLRDAWGGDLVSVVLFGSAAEGKLAATSDVNVLLVLRTFAPSQVAQVRDTLLAARAAIRLEVMFLLVRELPFAANMFAQKFADILRRHRIIYGRDVLASLKVARNAEIFRLRQVLMNLTLRLRDAYVLRGQQPEQVSRILADAVGPLRAACATLLELEGVRSVDSRSALEQVAVGLDDGNRDLVARLFAAHAGEPLGADAEQTLFATTELLMRMSDRTALLEREA
jgi:predicted nucleotidyltransferase